METRKNKSKIIATIAIFISMLAGITATLFTLPKSGTVFAAESFNHTNPSKYFKVAEIGDSSNVVYIKSFNTDEIAAIYKKYNFKPVQLITFENLKVSVVAGGEDYRHMSLYYFGSREKSKLFIAPTSFLEHCGDDVTRFNILVSNGDQYDIYKDNVGCKLDSVKNLYLDYEYKILSVENNEFTSHLYVKNNKAGEGEDSTETGGSGNQGGSSGETDNPGSGSGSGGSGSQGGSSGGSENPGDNTPGDDNKGTETPKFSLDKVSYICIGVIAVSAVVVIILKRRNKNKRKEQ